MVKNLISLGVKAPVVLQSIFFREIWENQAEIEPDPKYTCIFITFSCDTENIPLIPPSWYWRVGNTRSPFSSWENSKLCNLGSVWPPSVKLDHCCRLKLPSSFLSYYSLGFIKLLCWLNGIKPRIADRRTTCWQSLQPRDGQVPCKNNHTVAAWDLVGERKHILIHSFSTQSLLARVRSKMLALLEELNTGDVKKGQEEGRGTEKSQKSIKLVIRKPEF